MFKIKIAVVAAFVAFLGVIADVYTDIPITIELINSVVVILLGWFGVEIVELLPGIQKVVAKLRERSLW